MPWRTMSRNFFRENPCARCENSRKKKDLHPVLRGQKCYKGADTWHGKMVRCRAYRVSAGVGIDSLNHSLCNFQWICHLSKLQFLLPLYFWNVYADHTKWLQGLTEIINRITGHSLTMSDEFSTNRCFSNHNVYMRKEQSHVQDAACGDPKDHIFDLSKAQ